MSSLMIVHVAAGAIAVLSGFLALLTRKGARVHRAAGTAFFITMSISALAGAFIAWRKPEMVTFLAGAFTFYLVATSWLTIRRHEKKATFIEGFLASAALLISVCGALWGMEALGSTTQLKDGYAADVYFFFAGLALLAGLADLSVLLRRGVNGRQRIARHLWRMTFALFIAAGSLFTGPGAKTFPEFMRSSPLMSAPELITILLLLFWLIRVLATSWIKAGR